MMLLVFMACHSLGKLSDKEIFPDDIHLYTYEDQIAPVQDINGLHPTLQDNFALYTQLTAPNGQYLHLLAQAGVQQKQLIRARSILEFYLTDRETLEYGDKTTVFNAMADNEATLLIFDTESTAEQLIEGELGDLDLFFQDLYATESLVEGSSLWLDGSQRDASFEEIFHLVHGAGIDVAWPALAEQIDVVAQQAFEAGIWTPEQEQLDEWAAEDSVGKEYIISVIDVYYGLWAHQETALYGEYQPSTRVALQEEDPQGIALIESLLPATLDYEVRIDDEFTGVFDSGTSEDWGFKSQYFEHLRLMGNASSDVYGNALDNHLQGNQADNFLRGEGGEDTAIMQGMRNEYEVQITDDGILLFDSIADRDGSDYLVGIEWIQFSDQRVSSQEIQPN